MRRCRRARSERCLGGRGVGRGGRPCRRGAVLRSLRRRADQPGNRPPRLLLLARTEKDGWNGPPCFIRIRTVLQSELDRVQPTTGDYITVARGADREAKENTYYTMSSRPHRAPTRPRMSPRPAAGPAPRFYGLVAASRGSGRVPHRKPHMMRHTFATDVFDATEGDLYAVKELLGHSSTRVTEVFRTRRGRGRRPRSTPSPSTAAGLPRPSRSSRCDALRGKRQTGGTLKPA